MKATMKLFPFNNKKSKTKLSLFHCQQVQSQEEAK